MSTGLTSLDLYLDGGLWPNRLNIIFGPAHQGKTAMMLTILANNPEARAIFMTMDEDPNHSVIKLIAMTQNITTSEARELPANERIAITRDTFPNLLTSDQCSSPDMVYRLTQMAQEGWGAPADIIFYDYFGLMVRGVDYSSSVMVMRQLKDLVIRGNPDSVFLIGHQANRAGAMAKGLSMYHMSQVGEADIDGACITVRRRKFTEALTQAEMMLEDAQPTINIGVAKNKVNGKTTSPAGDRFYIDPVSGMVTDDPAQATWYPGYYHGGSDA